MRACKSVLLLCVIVCKSGVVAVGDCCLHTAAETSKMQHPFAVHLALAGSRGRVEQPPPLTWVRAIGLISRGLGMKRGCCCLCPVCSKLNSPRCVPFCRQPGLQTTAKTSVCKPRLFCARSTRARSMALASPVERHKGCTRTMTWPCLRRSGGLSCAADL